MGYLHIPNTYKTPWIFAEARLYALEKVHGTSCHVRFRSQNATEPDDIFFFHGGCERKAFLALFEGDLLWRRYVDLRAEEPHLADLTVYGEGYGGKLQGMRDTYGERLAFVAFDVKVGEVWLPVPEAERVAGLLGFEFVPYALITGTVAAADAERDRESTVAARRGCGHGKPREGVVLRPLTEGRLADGGRVIAKHKRAEFRETKTPRPVDADRVTVLRDAEAVADEWVTPERLRHVVDHVRALLQAASPGSGALGIEATGAVVREATADVRREAAGEVEFSREVDRAVATRAARLYKDWLRARLGEEVAR